jgi:hypothetical protein
MSFHDAAIGSGETALSTASSLVHSRAWDNIEPARPRQAIKCVNLWLDLRCCIANACIATWSAHILPCYLLGLLVQTKRWTYNCHVRRRRSSNSLSSAQRHSEQYGLWSWIARHGLRFAARLGPRDRDSARHSHYWGWFVSLYSCWVPRTMCLARQDSCLTGGTIGPHPRNIYFSVLETRSGLEYFLCRRTKSYTPELTSNDLDQEFSVHVFYDIVAVGINIETCMHVLSPGSA